MPFLGYVRPAFGLVHQLAGEHEYSIWAARSSTLRSAFRSSFFLLAVIASAVTEWVAWVMKLRAKMLREGLEGMLGEKTSSKRSFSTR